MKNLALLLIISGIIVASACSKNEKSERFLLLTGPEWATDSILANGADARQDPVFGKFMGDARFNTDGTGFFGIYTGTWRFNVAETQITIVTDSLPLPIVNDIIELTKISFKIKTLIPNQAIPDQPIKIRMTFKAK